MHHASHALGIAQVMTAAAPGYLHAEIVLLQCLAGWLAGQVEAAFAHTSTAKTNALKMLVLPAEAACTLHRERIRSSVLGALPPVSPLPPFLHIPGSK